MAATKVIDAAPSIRPDMYWDADNPESMLDSPFDEIDDDGRGYGFVHEVWCAVKMPSIFVAALPPAPDSYNDDEWRAEAATAADVQALLDAEIARRAVLEEVK